MGWPPSASFRPPVTGGTGLETARGPHLHTAAVSEAGLPAPSQRWALRPPRSGSVSGVPTACFSSRPRDPPFCPNVSGVGACCPYPVALLAFPEIKQSMPPGRKHEGPRKAGVNPEIPELRLPSPPPSPRRPGRQQEGQDPHAPSPSQPQFFHLQSGSHGNAPPPEGLCELGTPRDQGESSALCGHNCWAHDPHGPFPGHIPAPAVLSLFNSKVDQTPCSSPTCLSQRPPVAAQAD